MNQAAQIPAAVAADRSGHRSDIDGLRAIAIAGVLAFHAFPSLLPGGFVGVDVFFVISGYLITGIVRRETTAGRFSVAAFYERRIRRILPALAVVLAVTSLVALVILPPEDLKAYGRSLPPSIAFAANFHFWTRGSYFSPPQDVRPLLHLWSLGVEEQFYIVWPWLLVLCRKWSARKAGLGLLLLVVASLIADEAVLRRDALAAFYLTPLRAWEPLLGGLLAIGWIAPTRSAGLRQALGLAGLALIVASMAVLRETMPFPGLAAAPACLGAAMIVQAGRAGEATLAGRLLGLGPMVWLGGISYSLYLWHWPIVTFLRLGVPGEPSPWLMAAGVAASVLLAALSAQLVEQRFRHRPAAGLSRRALFGVTFAGIAGLALCGSLLQSDQGLRGRASGLALETMAAEHDLSPEWRNCHDRRGEPEQACVFGDPQAGPPQMLLWGDSMAASWAEPIVGWAQARGMKVRMSSLAACLPSLGVDVHEADGRITPCRTRNEQLLDLVRHSPRLKLVVLVARWPIYDSGSGTAEGVWYFVTRPGGVRDPRQFHAIFQDGLDRLVQALLREGPAGLKIVIVGPSPEFPVNPDRCAQRAVFVHRDPGPCLRISTAAVVQRQAGAIAVLQAVAAGRPAVSLVRPDPLFCDRASCSAVIGGRIGFIDQDHLTATVARTLGPRLTAGWPEVAGP